MMAIADELRQYADKAIKEGGMYFSGNYLDGLAKRAESEQAENAKLRKMLSELYEDQCDDGDKWKYRDRMRELGIEV